MIFASYAANTEQESRRGTYTPFMNGRRRLLPIRGRDNELEAVRRRLLDVREGSGGIILIEGSAGVGKTRLMDAVADIGSELSFRVGRGATEIEPERRVIDQVPRVEALLYALFDGDPPLLPRSAFDELRASPEMLFWLLQDLQSLIEKAALQDPLLLCLDDLHNAGTIVRGDDAGVAASLPPCRSCGLSPIDPTTESSNFTKLSG